MKADDGSDKTLNTAEEEAFYTEDLAVTCSGRFSTIGIDYAQLYLWIASQCTEASRFVKIRPDG
jgi:hypothetical protein